MRCCVCRRIGLGRFGRGKTGSFWETLHATSLRSTKEGWMKSTKKAKNAEHLGLRFSISFLRLKDELGTKVIHFRYRQ